MNITMHGSENVKFAYQTLFGDQMKEDEIGRSKEGLTWR
jgi:hypothetical protein